MKNFMRGDYILEYAGTLLTKNEAVQMDEKYNQAKAGSFMYYFKHQDIPYW